MNSLTKNSLITFLTRCITLVSGFILSICSAHFLGPEGRGDYFFVISISVLMIQLGCLGTQSSNLLLVVKSKDAIADLTTNAVWISVFIGICAALMTYLIFRTMPPIPGLKYIIILAPASLFYMLATNLLVGINKIKTFNLLQICSNISVGLILIICGYLGCSVQGFLTATALSWLSFAFVLLVIISRISKLNFRFNILLFKQGFGFGIKTYICCLSNSFILKSNVFLLKYFHGSEILGYYSVAAQFNDILALLPASFSLILFPEIIKNPNTGWDQMKSVLIPIFSCLLGIELIIVANANWEYLWFLEKNFLLPFLSYYGCYRFLCVRALYLLCLNT